MRALTVTHAFGDYGPGDQIIDKAAMKAALETNPRHVVPVNLPKPDADDAGSGSQKSAAKAADAKPASQTATSA